MVIEYTDSGTVKQIRHTNIGSGWIDYKKPSSDRDRTRNNPDGTQYRYQPHLETWTVVPQVDEDENWDYRKVQYWHPKRGSWVVHNTPGWHPYPFPKAKKKPTPPRTAYDDDMDAILIIIIIIGTLIYFMT